MELIAPYWKITKSAFKFYISKWFVKKWRRDSIPLVQSGANMYVDVNESRGQALFILDGRSQPRLSHFWSESVRQFSPDYALDVGVNYGECLFSVTYPTSCKIIGIEANLGLKPYIERTKLTHPNKQDIQIVYALASDQSDVMQTFYVNKYWSGVSSAVASRLLFKKMYHSQTVQQRSIDSLFANESLAQKKLLFKIDVEGYEPKVLAGMHRLLTNCRQSLGFIEFDSDYIQRAGFVVNDFLQTLTRTFDVYVYVTDEQLTFVTDLNVQTLQKLFDKKTIHTDFLLVSRGTPLPQLDVKIRTYMV